MPKREQAIQKEIMLALSQAGCLIWRNNTGVAWQGEQVNKTRDTITLRNYRPVHFGLCKGSADLIGVTPCGRFLACEVKTPTGRASDAQQRFLLAVNRAGGLGFIARSADEALATLKQFTEAPR